MQGQWDVAHPRVGSMAEHGGLPGHCRGWAQGCRQRHRLLLIFIWHLGGDAKGWAAAEDGGRASAQSVAAHCSGTLEQDNTPGTSTLSTQLESLQLQSCLRCWQMSQSQESGRSAGTRSCSFVPAVRGQMALPSVETTLCSSPQHP